MVEVECMHETEMLDSKFRPPCMDFLESFHKPFSNNTTLYNSVLLKVTKLLSSSLDIKLTEFSIVVLYYV